MIVVFGSINIDLVAHVARLPNPGETLAATRFAVVPGGKGGNQALAARRAGADVVMIGAVGDDAFAAPALRNLADAGVDLTRIVYSDVPTGVALIHVDALGQNSITVVAGANARTDPAAVPDSLLAPGTTLLMQLEVPLSSVEVLAARARRCGARVILNAAPCRDLPLALFASLDVLVVNDVESAAMAAGLDAPKAPDAFAAALHRRFGCSTVVTLGAEGAVAATGGLLLRASSPPVEVIDTTGAGDAFVGALAACLDRGMLWNRALSTSIAAGSLACTVAGAQSALPGAAAIDRLASTVESELVAHRID